VSHAATAAAATLAALLAGALASPAGAGDDALGRIDFDHDHARRWKLPRRLAEVSGLTTAGGGRLFAHEDQHARVFELDPVRRRVVRSFSLGDPVVRGDFEGIAFAHGRIHLVTSSGALFVSEVGEDGAHVAYQRHDTRVGGLCREVEGLDYDPTDDVLLLACKRARSGKHVLIHRWSLVTHTSADPALLRIRARKLRKRKVGSPFRPSAITRDPRTGHYLVLSSLAHGIAEIAPDGKVEKVRGLSRSDHGQPEGMAVLEDGTLAIADEARRGRRARLTLHPPKGEHD